MKRYSCVGSLLSAVVFVCSLISPVQALNESTHELVSFKSDGAYIAHRTVFYDCNQAGGLIVEPASVELWPLLYRTPAGTPGRALTVASLSFGCGLAEIGGGWRPGGPAPVTVEIAELAPPSALADFYGYTLARPPEIRRIVGRVVSGETRAFDIGDTLFLGFRVVEAPPPAFLGPAFEPYDTREAARSLAAPGACVAFLQVSID